MSIVKTDKGYVSGTIIGELGKEVSVYRGIPFAAPPVGNLRWKPPQPAELWDGIRECTKFSLISPQPVMGNMTGEMPQGEDCLYLNVLTPAREPDEKLPVLVYIPVTAILGQLVLSAIYSYTLPIKESTRWAYRYLPSSMRIHGSSPRRKGRMPGP